MLTSSFLLAGCNQSNGIVPNIDSNKVEAIVSSVGGDSIPHELLQANGRVKVMENAYYAWLDNIRLSSINNGVTQQTKSNIEEILNNLSEVQFLSGVYTNSQTGQSFTRLFIHSKEERLVLITKLQPYGGWCFTNQENQLVCDIPMDISI